MKVFAIIQGALGDGIMALWGLKAVADHTSCLLSLVCAPGLGALAMDLGLAQSAYSVQSPEMASLYGVDPSPWVKDQIQSHDVVLVFSFSKDLFQSVDALATKAVQILPRPLAGETIHVLDHILGHLHKAGMVKYSCLKQHNALPNVFDLHSLHTRKPDSPVLIHPGSGSPRKNWSLNHFADLYFALESKGIPGKFVLGPDDHALEIPLRELLQDAVLKQPESVLELKACLLDSRAYVGNDSGATHLAAMLGAPTVAIFGPSDPARWRPVGSRACVLQPSLTCDPCFETLSENCENVLCLQNTSPGAVLKALEDLGVHLPIAVC
ncbi:MAG: hypothetical protein JEZ02_09945 [Desulfatibacillum sp.]|nr:hypothetical protein [Desulfatibacillum sp.]